jgi:predicted dehydrogenase
MFPLSRREFLKGSALLAASAATAGLTKITDAPIDAQAPGGANERINVAVIGVNGRGMDHINGFTGQQQQHNCRVTHICDPDSAVVQRAVNRVRERQNGLEPAVVTDLRRLFENRDIHAVSIATPNHWHSLAAIWAMQAGKDVYVEKPISHNVSEGRRVVEISRSTSRMCQAGTQIRSSTGVRQAMEFMRAGNLGQVRVARALCYKRRTSIGRHQGEVAIPRTVDYDLWCGPAPRRPLTRLRLHYDWHWQWDYGNGDLGNQGIHQMDVARWGLGKSELCRTVQSVGGRFGYSDDGETANTQICWFDYGDQQLIFEVRGLTTPALKGVHVGNIFYCANGYMVFPNYNSAVAYDLDGGVIRRFSGPDNHYGNFLQAVRSRRREGLNGEVLEGHLSSALCHLGNISYRLGRQQAFEPRPNIFANNPVLHNTMVVMEEHLQENGVPLGQTQLTIGRRLTIDAAAERFQQDEEANRMLTREYRQGFVVPARA